MVAALENGTLDVAIAMIDVVDWPQLKSVKLRTEKIIVVGEPGHPLASKKTVLPKDLAGQALMVTETGCSYRLKFDRMLAAANVKPGSTTEFTSVEAIKQCAFAGMGFGVLPEIVVAREIKAKQLAALRWAGPSLDIAIHALWHKDKWLSPNIAAFLQTLHWWGSAGPWETAISIQGPGK